MDVAEGSCSSQRNCTGLPSAKYPLCDSDCRWYFTCDGGYNRGNTYCGDESKYTVYGV